MVAFGLAFPLVSLLYHQAQSASSRTCNASELFDVLLHDFWLLQFGHSYLGGQLPDTEPSYALAIASCQVYSTQFERHRFLIQACFQAGEHKSTALQHRMAGLCNPKVLNSLKPNLACLKSIYGSRSYDVCMASALHQFATSRVGNGNDSLHQNPAPMRYSDAPYHCVNVRQSVLCSQYPMNVHCAGEQLNDVRAMFDNVWSNNAVVEGHYECSLSPLAAFQRKTAVKEDLCKC